jgi:hypothetical protein
MRKWKVSKHGYPLVKYPWEVDGPDGEISDVFVTWAEAIEHVRKNVRQHDDY